MLTGHIYPETLKQSVVYVTKLEAAWIDYGLVIPAVFFAAAFYLNSRWKIIPDRPYLPKPKKLY